uniref:Integrase, catalytic region, zinc finger, CCHC-type, peptidase aspartic, catalytic n=1 Tax=Tanacetum cinerariifolium TaxID=118510 RepID=A0A6L2MZZ0_TANCI|nr:integrase, catalytic region, zinc finger, CCHC-type, peptidase aspartic, catalytic [Tanacetum cinerariifolium]
MLNPSTKSRDALPVKIEALKELLKVSLVNESLKKLKLHLSNFDKVVKIRTTPNSQTEEKNESYDKCFNLDAELLESQNVHNDLLKRNVQARLDPLAPKLLQNKEAHINNLKCTQEQADILHEIVEQAKVKQPLDNVLDFACKHAQRIQELLIYVQDICPNAINLSAKKVAATPKNNVKKVRFVEPLTSLSNNKQVVQIVLWYLDSRCSKHMTRNRSHLMNFISKFLGRVRFGNDHIARIMGYGDYLLGNVTISRVYYFEGLRHNLFFVGQFCNSDLKVAFWKNTCLIRNLEGVDLLSGSRDINLYTISLDDMLKTSLIYLLSTTSKTKSWLWHLRLSHLNFGTLNKLAKDVQEAATLRAMVLADSPVSTSIDQDAPSTRSSSNVRQTHTPLENLGRWTKDHPIANVIDDPSRFVSTRKQLQTDAMWCYIDSFLTSVEPKNFKQSMTKPSWIDAMQEEIHKFERLQV